MIREKPARSYDLMAAPCAHKLRASLTMLGLTVGVATLITVMTIVQGGDNRAVVNATAEGTEMLECVKMLTRTSGCFP